MTRIKILTRLEGINPHFWIFPFKIITSCDKKKINEVIYTFNLHLLQNMANYYIHLLDIYISIIFKHTPTIFKYLNQLV